MENKEIIKKIVKKEKEYIDNYSIKDDYELSELTDREINQIICDILMELDPNGDWLEIYLKARRTAHIIYINELDKEGLKKYEQILGISGLKRLDNTCLNISSDESFVFLNYEGNISDVVFTIHEIAHYINARLDDVTSVSPYVREFPSIFYEMYALNYLKNLWYPEGELLSIYNKRIFETYESLEMTSKLGIENTSYTPYVIGSYLGREAMNKLNDDKLLLSIIKYITENLSRTRVEELFYLVNNNKNKKLKR